MNNNIIPALIITIGLVVVGIFTGMQVQQYVKNQAIVECMKASSVQWKSDNNVTTTPHYDWFNICLKKQGYE
jgi:hypothetical protein